MMFVVLTSLVLSVYTPQTKVESISREAEKEIHKIQEKVVETAEKMGLKQTNLQEVSTVAEAFPSEAVFTIANDKKPIVASYGANSGVILGGYEETNQIAFVVHFANKDEVIKCRETILDNISKLMVKPLKKPIQIHLRGGVLGESEETIAQIKKWMDSRVTLPMQVASEDVLPLRQVAGGKSLAIDARNGEVTAYNPVENPGHRESGKLDTVKEWVNANMSHIKVAYTPG